MELDSLKELWQQSGVKQAAANEDIVAMLNKRSQSPIARMKRNVLIELTLVIVLFTSVAVFYFIAFKGTYREIAWMYLLLMSASVFYYYRKWRLLHAMQCVACRVKSNLELQVKLLEKYVRFYLWFGTALIPLVVLFLGVLFHLKFPASNGWFFPSFSGEPITSFAIWLALLVGLTGVIFVINRWYVKKLYGRHIQQLKAMLEQMEE